MNMKVQPESGVATMDDIASLLMGTDDSSSEEENKKELDTNSQESDDTSNEDTSSQDTDDADEQSDESTDENEEESEEETEDESNESDESTWESVLGIPEDKLHFDDKGNITGITVKVNGESSVVSMPDLVAGFQLNKAVTQKSQALSEERKVFEQEREQVAQTLRGKFEEAEAIASFMEQSLVDEYNAIDWNKLRVESAGEAALKQQEFAEKAAGIERAKEALRQQRQQDMEQVQEQMLNQRKARISAERDKMLITNPTWNDQAVFKKDMGELKSFLSDQYGFTDNDFKLVEDARLIELIKDASKFHKGAKMAKQKITRKVPKFQKSEGKPVKKKVSKVKQLKQKADNATGTNKREFQMDAIASVLLGEE